MFGHREDQPKLTGIRSHLYVHTLRIIDKSYRSGKKLPHTIEMLEALLGSDDDQAIQRELNRIVRELEFVYQGCGTTPGCKQELPEPFIEVIESSIERARRCIQEGRYMNAVNDIFYTEETYLQEHLSEIRNPHHNIKAKTLLERVSVATAKTPPS